MKNTRFELILLLNLQNDFFWDLSSIYFDFANICDGYMCKTMWSNTKLLLFFDHLRMFWFFITCYSHEYNIWKIHSCLGHDFLFSFLLFDFLFRDTSFFDKIFIDKAFRRMLGRLNLLFVHMLFNISEL